MRKIDEIKASLVQFTCNKVVKATPMTKAQYHELRGLSSTESDFREEGYLVMYEPDGNPNHPDFEGHISWSPTATFENGYTISETFGDRLRLEYIDLLEKIEKLDAFIGNISISKHTIKIVDVELLNIQLNAMRTYARVLKARLVLLTTTH